MCGCLGSQWRLFDGYHKEDWLLRLFEGCKENFKELHEHRRKMQQISNTPKGSMHCLCINETQIHDQGYKYGVCVGGGRNNSKEKILFSKIQKACGIPQPRISPVMVCVAENHCRQTNTWRQNHQSHAPDLLSLLCLVFSYHMLNTPSRSRHWKTVIEWSQKFGEKP